MNIGEAAKKRTSDLIDELGHEAGLVGVEHHLHGQAFVKSGATLHRERHEDASASDVAEHVAVDGILEAVALGAERVAEYTALASRVASYVEAGAELLSIAWLVKECGDALIDAESKADEIRAAFDNDAVNCAIAGNLAFHPAFAVAEQHARPGVIKGTTKLTLALQDPKNPIRPVLQARADEGYLVAERAAKSGVAIPQWLEDHGYAQRLKDDVAFAKGVEYHAFVAHAGTRYGIDAGAELRKVQERAPIERSLMVQP